MTKEKDKESIQQPSMDLCYLVSWHLRNWVHFLARHQICTNNYILLQFPKETNTKGSKTLTPFTPFHKNVQSFDLIKRNFHTIT